MDNVVEAFQPAIGFLALIGLLIALPLVAKIVISTYKTFLRPGKDLKKLGKWAVVTGATDGIGKAYAFALAKGGLNIVLISRTESKLQEVKAELEKKGYAGVEVAYVVCDYSKFDDDAKAKVKKAIADLDVGVLVNNVGVSYRYPRFFDELSDEEVTNLLTMNIDSTVWMTRMVLPGMLERKRGTVVSISSASARYTLPLLAQYSGAKSFVQQFSASLNAEYAATKGVTFQCQVPFYVATKLAKMRKSVTVPTPTEYVDMAIKWVGYPDALVSPFWIHAVQGWIMLILPESLVTGFIMKMHLAIRKKGIKKDERRASEAAAKKE